METIEEAIAKIKLEIAMLDYSGSRYIADKQKIADSFKDWIFSDNYGAIGDSYNGQVWAVFTDSQGRFKYIVLDP